MKNNTKYVYSATGDEIKEIEKILKDSGFEKQLSDLVDTGFDLIKNKDFDRTQLEMYVSNNFSFRILSKIMAEPLFDMKDNDKPIPNTKKEKKDGKRN